MMRRVIGILMIAGLTLLLGSCGDDSPTAPQYEELTYVALGASDAVGIGAFPLDNGYVYRIRDKLDQHVADEVLLYNLGVSGARADEIAASALPAALAHQPQLVTLWTGPNDLIGGESVEAFQEVLGQILAPLSQQTSALVVVANIPDLTILPRFLLKPDDDVTMERIQAFNQAIALQAAAYNVPVVDLFAKGDTANWDYVSLDGFHPSNDGHQRLAELFLEVIGERL